MNDRGDIVDDITTAAGAFHAVVWTARGGKIGLGSGIARAINDTGQVTGSTGADRGFFWDPRQGMVDLGTLGGSITLPWAMNNRGQVVGWSLTATGDFHAFLWDRRHGMVDLGTLGGRESLALAVSDSGQVVGQADRGPTARRVPRVLVDSQDRDDRRWRRGLQSGEGGQRRGPSCREPSRPDRAAARVLMDSRERSA